jgi:hypothetical protein
MVLTSWLVVSVIFNFFVVRFHIALRGLLGGTGMLASRLACFSMMIGIFGIPARHNLDCS